MDISAYWKDTLAQDRQAMAGYFRPDAVIRWHCTNEQFTVPEFIRANCEYPGEWDGKIERTERSGDLLVTVIVRPHARFERDGTSVLLEQEISYAQAALGAEVEVPTLDGKVKLTIPEGTQPGAVFRLRGKGIPYLRGSGRGDQFVSVTVKVPKNLTSSQKELLRQFAASMGELDTDAGRGVFGRKKK